MIIYTWHVPGGHDIDSSISVDRADPIGEFGEEAVQDAEREGRYDDEFGATLVAYETKLWTIVIGWSDPEDGVAAYGPYSTEEQANEDVCRVCREYHGWDPVADLDEWKDAAGVVVETQKLTQ